MRELRVTAAVAAATLVAAAAAASGSAAASSGVRGVVLLSHGCPGPVRPAAPPRRCAFPGAGVVVRVFRRGAVVPIRSLRTDTRGRFAFRLPAGAYVLRVVVARVREEKPTTVVVRQAAWTSLSLYYLVSPYME